MAWYATMKDDEEVLLGVYTERNAKPCSPTIIGKSSHQLLELSVLESIGWLPIWRNHQSQAMEVDIQQ